jgi:hypothetical protein
VVKLASYGGGGRAAAMMSYTSRGGDLAVENERGERVLGRDALSEQRAEWEHLFDNRASSRDLGVFFVSIDAASLRNDVDQDEQLREILRSGFGDRRFVYTARERSDGELNVSGVVVLRDGASASPATGKRRRSCSSAFTVPRSAGMSRHDSAFMATATVWNGALRVSGS